MDAVGEETVLNWPKELTCGTKLSSVQVDISPFLKVKGFEYVLYYLVNHARPLKERQHIRNNLKHHHIKKNRDVEKSITEIHLKHATVQKSVEETAKDLAVEAEGLKKLVEREENLLEEERDLKSKINLLRMANKERGAGDKAYRMWSSAVLELKPESRQPRTPTEEALLQEAANEDVDFAFSKLKQLKKSSSAHLEEDFIKKKEVWNFFEELVKRHSPVCLMKALTSNTHKEILAVAEATRKVDLVGDAKSLRLKYNESGEFVDELRPHGILETVESMLIQMSCKHVKQHLKVQKMRKEIKCIQESLANVSSSVQASVKDNCDTEMQSELLKYYELSLKVAGLKALPSAVCDLKTNLEGRAKTAEKARQAIEEKFQNIQNFSEQVKNRNLELKSMVVSGLQSLTSLEEERCQIGSFVKRALACLDLPTPVSKGSFSKEVEGLSLLPPSALIPPHLSGHNYLPCNPQSITETWDESAEEFGELVHIVPFVTSWQNLIETVRLKKLGLKCQENLVSNGRDSLKLMSEVDSSLTVPEIKAVCQKAKLHDVELENQVIPLLNNFEETNVCVSQELNKLNKAVDEWWNQPGDSIRKYLAKK